MKSSKQIFTRNSRDQARRIVDLAYYNPFLPERIDRERAALGSEFKELGEDWNRDPRILVNNPNIHRLSEISRKIADSSRERFLSFRTQNSDTQLYEKIIYYLTFYTFIQDLEKLSQEHFNQPHKHVKVGFFDKFDQFLRHYLGDEDRITDNDIDHIFAICFQVRRAFNNIFRFFIGASDEAMQLRARLWQSIFTHNLDRYWRSLASRMQLISTLITGPSGSGKEVVARALVASQYLPFNRSTGKLARSMGELYYPVNLAALSQTLIESELFGHKKGAFTGALNDRKGFFEVCPPEGMVFLDEIGETSAEIQVKLLRLLQSRRFQPVGSTSEQEFHGKVVTATNRNLEEEIKQGRFREDLYYRLCSDIIVTPSLHAMMSSDPSEILRMVTFISVNLIGEEEAPKLIEEVMHWIGQHPDYTWHGNFRELQQAVRNIMVHGQYEARQVKDNSLDSIAPPSQTPLTAEEMLRKYTRRIYTTNNNYSETARLLQLDRRTVRKYLEEE